MPLNFLITGTGIPEVTQHRWRLFQTLYKEPFLSPSLQSPPTLVSLALPTFITWLPSERNQAALGNGASCWLVQRTIYSTHFSLTSLGRICHWLPPPLPPVSSNGHHRGLNLKVSSPEIEPQIPSFPIGRPWASHMTSPCLTPFSVNMDRNTCLPSRACMRQQTWAYTVIRTAPIT